MNARIGGTVWTRRSVWVALMGLVLVCGAVLATRAAAAPAPSTSATLTVSTAVFSISGGTGRITGPGGIDCPTQCSADFPDGTTVVLTAEPTAGSRLSSWGGDPACTGSTALTCTITLNGSNAGAFASFNDLNTLTVVKDGAGAGRVSSNPLGIDCGTDCDQAYDSGNQVDLTAQAAPGSRFTGWSGGGCSGGATDPAAIGGSSVGHCTVTMSTDQTVHATFSDLPTLTVVPAGSGVGVVTSSSTPNAFEGAVVCGNGATACTRTFEPGTTVHLDPGTLAGSRFVSWSGCTANPNGSCTILMNADATVTATFVDLSTLTAATAGAGAGTVETDPTGINCPGDCSEVFDTGTQVDIKATAASGSRFTGWTGGGNCDGTTAAICTHILSADTTVTANFVDLSTLTVTKAGAGSGTVTSNPAGISCGATCSGSFATGTNTVLTADAASGSRFTGWSGGCSGTGTCTVTLNADTTVTATFVDLATLTVAEAGTGTGTVASAPAGIDCGDDCTEAYDPGSSVVLTATAASGSRFTGWTGGGCSGTDTCTVVLTADTTVTATFERIPPVAAQPPPRGGQVDRPGDGTCGAITPDPGCTGRRGIAEA